MLYFNTFLDNGHRIWLGNCLASNKELGVPAARSHTLKEPLCMITAHGREKRSCIGNPYTTCPKNIYKKTAMSAVWITFYGIMASGTPREQRIKCWILLLKVLEEPSAEVYLSMKSLCGIGSMERMRAGICWNIDWTYQWGWREEGGEELKRPSDVMLRNKIPTCVKAGNSWPGRLSPRMSVAVS